MTENPKHLILFAAFFVKVYLSAFANIYNIYDFQNKVGGHINKYGLYFRMLSSSSASEIKLWNYFKI